jgi:16S rRNA C967 or C1407 C5-methylase (RsmB/RsmF family)
MIPPLFLNIQKDDLVLDMCAAPGSKTSQILELFAAKKSLGSIENVLTGGVVANDMNKKRAYMLTHQLKRIPNPGMAVINHEGQFIPTIYNDGADGRKFDRRIQFDKVLVDAPCSGDGAIRKLPGRWKLWKSDDGFDLHKV